jgi:hypothetical protein
MERVNDFSFTNKEYISFPKDFSKSIEKKNNSLQKVVITCIMLPSNFYKFLLYPSKNDVAIKITIELVINYYWILIKL